jgi:CheY-like chemotaxis protein
MEMYSRTVLIVEDELLIRMMLADALQDEGYRVLEAETVLEAIGLLGRNRVDALITDVDMPGGLSGLDLVRTLHANCREIPTIVASGGHIFNDLDLPGNARFFAKPYRLDQLISALAAMFRDSNDVGYRLAG